MTYTTYHTMNADPTGRGVFTFINWFVDGFCEQEPEQTTYDVNVHPIIG